MTSSWFGGAKQRRLEEEAERQVANLRRELNKVSGELIQHARDQRTMDNPDSLLLAKFERIKNEIAQIEQQGIRDSLSRLGIDIPAQYLKTDWTARSYLTPEGVNWSRREVKKGERSEVESWGRALAPFLTFTVSLLSALISLGSLLVAWAALHKR